MGSGTRQTTRETVRAPRRFSRQVSRDVDYRRETLAVFGRELSEHAGGAVPFMAAVVELATVRAEIRAVKARRAGIYEQLTRRYRQGSTVTSDGAHVLRMTRPAVREAVRTVDSETIKRHARADWERSRVAVRRVAVSGPSSLVVADDAAVRGLPAVPRGADPLDVVVSAYRHPSIVGRLDGLGAREAAAIAVLDGIADVYGWDGLPIAFSDGWRVGLSQRQFDAQRLAVIAPAVFDRYAIERIPAGSSRVYIAPADSAGDDETAGDSWAD